MCHARRIHSHRVFKQLAKRGKTSTGWFYGFKLHLITSSCEKGHGRLEERHVAVTSEPEWLDCKFKWKNLRSLIEITSFRTIDDKTTEHRRFYISGLELMAEYAGEIARSHWLIENHLHWVMDVNFGEDASLVSIGSAAENLGIFKRLAGALIRIDLGGIVVQPQEEDKLLGMILGL